MGPAVASRGSPAPGGQCLDRRPPPRLVNPASASGKKIDKQKKKKKKKVFSTKKTPREIGALESSGPIAFAPLKFAPTSWAGAPSKACARGSWHPPAPPPLGTPLGPSIYKSATRKHNCQRHRWPATEPPKLRGV